MIGFLDHQISCTPLLSFRLTKQKILERQVLFISYLFFLLKKKIKWLTNEVKIIRTKIYLGVFEVGLVVFEKTGVPKKSQRRLGLVIDVCWVY